MARGGPAEGLCRAAREPGSRRRLRGGERRPPRRRAVEPVRNQRAQHRRAGPGGARRSAAEGCGLALDTYHLNIEESAPVEAIRAAGGRIAHVQVCANDRGAPGNDHLDWPALLGALADAGYRGPLCIESFTPDNATIATAASIWRPLAGSPDALATEGLAFLRGVARSVVPTAPEE